VTLYVTYPFSCRCAASSHVTLNAKAPPPPGLALHASIRRGREPRSPGLCPSDIMDRNTTATCAPAALEAGYMAMQQQLRPACALLLPSTPIYL
jgi:hypothetical protein